MAGLTACSEILANKGKSKANIVLHDEVMIDRPVTDVWPQLLEFVRWYFAGAKIEHVKGEAGQVGYTLAVNALRHEIINIRPLQSVVWKSCWSVTCDVDYVFSDFSLEAVNGKSKFSRNIYSQEGFWSAETAGEFRKYTSQGKVPDSVRQNSLAFKAYIEKL